MKTVDIREIAPKDRHSLIFREFSTLDPGECFLLRTDHDPKPLYYQFEAEQKGRFDWESLSAGPDSWEVKLTRTVPEVTVASIVRDYPASMDLFNELGIDYCCHGNRSFEEAALEAGHSSNELLEQIRKIPVPSERLNVELWSATLLCDFIIMNHHNYVRKKLPEIKELSAKVLQAHGGEYPFLQDVKNNIDVLASGLMAHLQKEEEEMFPAIRAAEADDEWDTETTRSLQLILREEHEEAGDLIREIRQLTDDYKVPPDGCFSFHRFYDLLNEFEQDLYRHVHLENNILFNKLSEKTRKPFKSDLSLR